MPIVIVPIVPCPHIGKQPLVSINNTATSLPGSWGGYKILPLIISCPLGSNIRPLRIQSYSFKKCRRFSLMSFPFKKGPPAATNLTGLPHVCASIQKNFFTVIIYKRAINLENLTGLLNISQRLFEHTSQVY